MKVNLIFYYHISARIKKAGSSEPAKPAPVPHPMAVDVHQAGA